MKTLGLSLLLTLLAIGCGRTVPPTETATLAPQQVSQTRSTNSEGTTPETVSTSTTNELSIGSKLDTSSSESAEVVTTESSSVEETSSSSNFDPEVTAAHETPAVQKPEYITPQVVPGRYKSSKPSCSAGYEAQGSMCVPACKFGRARSGSCNICPRGEEYVGGRCELPCKNGRMANGKCDPCNTGYEYKYMLGCRKSCPPGQELKIGGYCSPFKGSPLVLSLHDEALELTAPEDGVAFDVTADGEKNKVSWFKNDKFGFVALDLNNDGIINDGTELFGNYTKINGSNDTAENGFEALRQYDLNNDNRINSSDEVFSELRVWVDTNLNGISDAGELKSMTDLGVEFIGLSYDYLDYEDKYGNEFREYGIAQVNGVTRDVVDLWFNLGQ